MCQSLFWGTRIIAGKPGLSITRGMHQFFTNFTHPNSLPRQKTPQPVVVPLFPLKILHVVQRVLAVFNRRSPTTPPARNARRFGSPPYRHLKSPHQMPSPLQRTVMTPLFFMPPHYPNSQKTPCSRTLEALEGFGSFFFPKPVNTIFCLRFFLEIRNQFSLSTKRLSVVGLISCSCEATGNGKARPGPRANNI